MSDIYIQVGKDNIVQRIHRTPFDPTYGLQATKEELEKTGYFVKEVKEPLVIAGKRAIAKFNPDTREVYYDYVAIPLTMEERMDTMEAAFNELLLSGIGGAK